MPETQAVGTRRTRGERRSSLVRRASDDAAAWHRGQSRPAGDTPFIEHPLEVARLLAGCGAPDAVVAAGLLHDVLEKTAVSAGDLRARYGAEITALVLAVSDRDPSASYRQRKRDLRAQVARAGKDAALIFAADSVSKVRELRRLGAGAPAATRPAARGGDVAAKLEHYRLSGALLARIAPAHPLTELLRAELTDLRHVAAGAAFTR